MLKRLFERNRNRDSIAAFLYGAIVAQSRARPFYAAMGVSDSLEGRFEMLVLHLVLLTRRLKPAGEEARAAGQAVFDIFCTDMDNALRELGVGDLSVPRRMREVGEAYFGRAGAYEAGLAGTAGLAEAIRRNVPADENTAGMDKKLAAYALATVARLQSQADAAILADGPDFPDAALFAAEDAAA